MEPRRQHYQSQRLRKGRYSAEQNIYLLTTRTHGHSTHFSDFEIARVAAAYIHSPQTWGEAKLLAWVLMPDHWHGLLQLGSICSLSKHMQQFKGGLSLLCRRHRQSAGAFWQTGYHDYALRSDEDMKTAARYIVQNPLRSGLVSHIGDYPFWNAVWL